MQHIVRHTLAFRTDPRLKPYVDKVAAIECMRPSDVIRLAIVEYLERKGVLKRSDLARSTEASE
jgi:hypothetical protein